MGNYSKQREKIIKVIEQMNNIPTAEEIYFEVKRVDSTINKSTIYRYLNYLVKNDLMIQIPVLNGPDRYFYNSSNKEYGFAICIKCGKIQEFVCDFDFSDFERKIHKKTGGINIMKKGMLIRGICDECYNININ